MDQVEFTSNAKKFRKLINQRNSHLAKAGREELVKLQEEWVKEMKESFAPFDRASYDVTPNNSVRSRSGALRSSVGGRVSGTTFKNLVAKLRVGSGRAGYARTQENGKTITPRNKKYLTVPLRDALNPSGTIKAKARIKGPFGAAGSNSKRKEYRTGFGVNTVVKTKSGKLLIVSRPREQRNKRTIGGGKNKGKLHGKVLYILKKSVTIKPRLNAGSTLKKITKQRGPKIAKRLTAIIIGEGIKL